MDQETLKQYLNYNPDTGEFTRLVVTSNRAGLGKFISRCMIDSKHYTFGYFNDAETAGKAYIEGKKNLAGDIADVIESVYE